MVIPPELIFANPRKEIKHKEVFLACKSSACYNILYKNKNVTTGELVMKQNKIQARLSYIHVPPRCRKARRDSIWTYGDTKEEARKLVAGKVKKIISTSKQYQFDKKVTYQPATIDGTVTSFNMFAIEGVDGCTSESFEEAMNLSREVS